MSSEEGVWEKIETFEEDWEDATQPLEVLHMSLRTVSILSFVVVVLLFFVYIGWSLYSVGVESEYSRASLESVLRWGSGFIIWYSTAEASDRVAEMIDKRDTPRTE